MTPSHFQLKWPITVEGKSKAILRFRCPSVRQLHQIDKLNESEGPTVATTLKLIALVSGLDEDKAGEIDFADFGPLMHAIERFLRNTPNRIHRGGRA